MKNVIIKPCLPEEHVPLCKLAKTSKWTRDFSNHMFSGTHAYAREWIQGAYLYEDQQDKLVGFYCVRHKVRTPATTLYFITVDPAHYRQGIAEALLGHMKEHSPHPCIELNVGVANVEAAAFYKKHGFVEVGPSLPKQKSDGTTEWTGTALRLEWTR